MGQSRRLCIAAISRRRCALDRQDWPSLILSPRVCFHAKAFDAATALISSQRSLSRHMIRSTACCLVRALFRGSAGARPAGGATISPSSVERRSNDHPASRTTVDDSGHDAVATSRRAVCRRGCAYPAGLLSSGSSYSDHAPISCGQAFHCRESCRRESARDQFDFLDRGLRNCRSFVRWLAAETCAARAERRIFSVNSVSNRRSRELRQIRYLFRRFQERQLKLARRRSCAIHKEDATY